ncbi:CBL-interacting serine/threonine-protein kinase 10-like isoform X3 [Impatiens glandulifera]|uniref:CBL-interacting serine/threonine-protein kinase 10-like isoform X3 n=1 Tax=Impatiens glandulifera TaxID=253017 RepID=UPI001FB04C03|nr:CBL-interacting serine/threonine-protein kinase 10-like isoform X3 [Impatiens glandulifera]
MMMDKKGSVLMERYEVGRLLGQGTFAKVYYGRSVKTGQGVAIKVIDKEKIVKVGLIEQIKREISVMRLIKHPNVVNLYEVMATKTKIYFVIEYAKGGELFNKVAKGRLKENTARKYFQELIKAVDFCHSRSVYHRDIKPENLLLDENENLKISDFGLSALADSKRQDGLLHTTCGTPAYVAPEVINRKGKIGKADYKCPSWFPPEVRKLLARILDPHPSTRISIAKIKENSWFKKGLNAKAENITTTATNDNNSDVASTSNQSNNDDSTSSGEDQKLANLNAFDIISFSAGFDLTGLFEAPSEKKEVRFTSRKPASVIISKLEEIAKTLKMKVSKRDAGLLKYEGLKEGRKGFLSIDAEIFEVTSSFHLVEVKKANGDTIEYQKMVKEEMRPALNDIVWTWQGEHQQLEQDLQLEPSSSSTTHEEEEEKTTTIHDHEQQVQDQIP